MLRNLLILNNLHFAYFFLRRNWLQDVLWLRVLVETPYIYATARSGLANNASVVNVADVGGLYNGQWIQAVSRWLTTVYTKTTVKLPKTGY